MQRFGSPAKFTALLTSEEAIDLKEGVERPVEAWQMTFLMPGEEQSPLITGLTSVEDIEDMKAHVKTYLAKEVVTSEENPLADGSAMRTASKIVEEMNPAVAKESGKFLADTSQFAAHPVAFSIVMRAANAINPVKATGWAYLFAGLLRICLGISMVVCASLTGLNAQGKFLVPVFYGAPDYLNLGLLQAYNILATIGYAALGSGLYAVIMGAITILKPMSHEILYDAALWGKSISRAFHSLATETMAIWVVAQVCGIANAATLFLLVGMTMTTIYLRYRTEGDNGIWNAMRNVLFRRNAAGTKNTYAYKNPNKLPISYASLVVSWLTLLATWTIIFLSAGYYGNRILLVPAADPAFVVSANFWLRVAIPVIAAFFDFALHFMFTIRYAKADFLIVPHFATPGVYDWWYVTLTTVRDITVAVCLACVGFPPLTAFGNVVYS
jgi:hypothetical protein